MLAAKGLEECVPFFESAPIRLTGEYLQYTQEAADIMSIAPGVSKMLCSYSSCV